MAFTKIEQSRIRNYIKTPSMRAQNLIRNLKQGDHFTPVPYQEWI